MVTTNFRIECPTCQGTGTEWERCGCSDENGVPAEGCQSDGLWPCETCDGTGDIYEDDLPRDVIR
jgi:hypothetical protein